MLLAVSMAYRSMVPCGSFQTPSLPNILTESMNSLGTPADGSLYRFDHLILVSETAKYLKRVVMWYDIGFKIKKFKC